MMPGLLAVALLAGAPLHTDSLARRIAVAPAESIQVTVAGPVGGPAVVIVPGLVSPAYAFRKLLPLLAEAGVRAVVIEPLGVGHSSRPGDADYSHTAQAHRVATVMDSLGLTHAVVMGHAVGTAVSLRLALARPELVGGLVLVEGGALESAAVPGVKKALQFSFLVRLFAGRGRIRKEVRKGLIASSGDTTWVTDSLIERYTEGPAGDMGAVLRALKGMQRSVEPDSLAPHLPQIHVPVLLLLGGAAHDGGPSTGRIRTLERRLPQLRERIVYGAGLHLHEEQPQVLADELLNMVHREGT
jgi:pimeloyl-ACP methyl ester carboxylesterase